MDFGLFLMPLHPPERPVADTYDDDLQTLMVADELGYREAWLGEHFTSAWENIPCPDLVIAKAAGRTRQIRFGTGVTLMPFHQPVEVALRAATLDQLTRGRFMLGVGSGGIGLDRRAFGIELSAADAAALTREGIEAVVKVWSGEPIVHHGKYFNIDLSAPDDRLKIGLALRPYQQPHPPVAIAGVSRASAGLSLAGEHGWIPMSTNFVPPDALHLHWEAVEKGAARTGRTASRREWRIAREIYVADSHEEALRDAREGAMARSFSEYMLPLVGSGAAGLQAFMPDNQQLPNEAITIDYLLNNIWIVGTPDECAAKLQSLYDQVGGFGTVLMIGHDWYPDTAKWFRSLELFAGQVMPRLAGLVPG